jgi:hypothetical protein
MSRKITERKPGQFSISGTPETVYYDRRTATRIAAQLEREDAEKAGKPMAAKPNQNAAKHGAKAKAQSAATDDEDTGE